MNRGTGGVGGQIARPRIIRPGRPTVRTTFQLAADLVPKGSESIDEVVVGSRNLSLKWLQEKYPERLPKSAITGDSFATDIPGQTLEGIAIPEEGLWSLRLTQPDAPYGNRAAVPGRHWTTEIALARQEGSVSFGIRVLCASLGYANEPISLTRPRIVVELSNTYRMRGADWITGTAWQPETEVDLERLLTLVADTERELPVYLLSVPDQKHLQMRTATYLLNHERFAKRCQGLAYVVTMPWELGFKWTELVGKPWSAFLGAVRTYLPGLDFENDLPSDHPRALAERILGFQYDGRKMEEAFESFLVDKAHEYASAKRVSWSPLLFVADARSRRAAIDRETASGDTEWKQLFEVEIDSLKAKIDELEVEAESYNDDAIATEKERDQALGVTHNLRLQVESLRTALHDKSGEEPDDSIPMPTSYDEIPEWVDKHLAGRLSLHARAISRGLKNPEFEDIQLVGRSLLLLANEYRNMRIGYPDTKEVFDRRLVEMSLRCSPSISEERAGEQGETYYARWPFASSPRRFIDWHIRSGGNTRDPKRCLAIYFVWDDESREVVVCWLPSHLANRLT